MAVLESVVLELVILLLVLTLALLTLVAVVMSSNRICAAVLYCAAASIAAMPLASQLVPVGRKVSLSLLLPGSLACIRLPLLDLPKPNSKKHQPRCRLSGSLRGVSKRLLLRFGEAVLEVRQ